MFYVTMTDKFMSGWGQAKNKKNKIVFECESASEAETVYQNALKRDEMIRVNIRESKPYYNDSFYVSWKNKKTAAYWYRQKAFEENCNA